MRWKGRRGSENVEYRGAAGGAPMMRVGGGIGMLVLLLIGAYFGVDLRPLMQNPQLQQGGPAPQLNPEQDFTPEQREMADFARVVLADTEDVWNELFREQGQRYEEPRLVLFVARVQSACG